MASFVFMDSRLVQCKKALVKSLRPNVRKVGTISLWGFSKQKTTQQACTELIRTMEELAQVNAIAEPMRILFPMFMVII